MILVTGATGFLGSHLVCHLLLNGQTVRALKRPDSRLDEFEYITGIVLKERKSLLLNKLNWSVGDVCDYYSLEEALQGVHTVFHCAGLVSFHPSDYDKLIKVNQEGTANMVNASLSAGVRVFCHISSTAAIGSAEDHSVMTEENIWKRTKETSQYSLSKYLAEMEVWRAAAEGLNVVVINPPIIIGPGLWKRGTCRFFYNTYKQFPFYSTGSNSFVNVGDVCRAAMLLNNEKSYGERFLVVGASLSFKEFLFEIADSMGRRRPYIKVGRSTSGLAWRLFRGLELFSGKRGMITKESSQSSVRNQSYSSRKIVDRLGFEFTDIHQTIAESASLCMKWLSETESDRA